MKNSNWNLRSDNERTARYEGMLGHVLDTLGATLCKRPAKCPTHYVDKFEDHGEWLLWNGRHVLFGQPYTFSSDLREWVMKYGDRLLISGFHPYILAHSNGTVLSGISVFYAFDGEPFSDEEEAAVYALGGSV